MPKLRGSNVCIRKKQSMSTKKRMEKASINIKLINYKFIRKALEKKFITDIHNQTFYKDDDGTFPSLIDIAIRNEDDRLLSFLMEQGVKPNFTKPLPRPLVGWIVRCWTLNKNFELMNAVLDAGDDINYRPHILRSVPLVDAIYDGNLDMIKFLIERGVDLYPPCVTGKRCFGCLPLIVAADKGKNDIIALLIKNGADVNRFCPTGYSALHHVAYSNNTQMIKLLIDVGADINAECKFDGQRPFHRALHGCSLEALQIFLSNESLDLDLFNPDSLYYSLIDYALKQNFVNSIDYLLDTNPDMNIINEDNELPVEVVIHNSEAQNKIKKHIVKLRAAGCFLHDRNVAAVSGKEFDNFYAECCQQVKAMKTIRISSASHLNFNDLLLMSYKKLALCLESMVDQGISESSLYEEFPLYSKMIEFQLKKAHHWVKLREAFSDAVYILFNKLLPTTIMEMIFAYFNFKELTELRKRRVLHLKYIRDTRFYQSTVDLKQQAPGGSNENQKTSHLIPMDVDD